MTTVAKTIPKVVKGTGVKTNDLIKTMPVAPKKTLPKIESKEIKMYKSKVTAAAGEILSLQADNALLKQDVEDKTETIATLESQLTEEKNLSSTFKTEAQTLKLTLRNDTTEHDNIKKIYNENLKELNAVKTKFEEMLLLVNEAKTIKQNHESEMNTTKTESQQKISMIQTNHAKELGKLKNKYETQVDEMHKRCAQTERTRDKDIKALKEENNKIETELKDTAVGLANRCNAYERRIDIQQKEINRLNMTLELKTRPNDYKEQQNEKTINELKTMNETQSKQIAEMMNKLNMINLNKHFDHRDNKWFT
tara:strand:- start:36303 stop:37229 length:927 start_codon:yes stop_codon:yes gene_type:complete